jgi:hypothetical protein
MRLAASLRDANDSPCLSVVLSCHSVEVTPPPAVPITAGGEGDDRPAMQQPDQPDDMIAAQAAVVRPTLLRRVMKAKQVLRCPAQRLRSLSFWIVVHGTEATAIERRLTPDCTSM